MSGVRRTVKAAVLRVVRVPVGPRRCSLPKASLTRPRMSRGRPESGLLRTLRFAAFVASGVDPRQTAPRGRGGLRKHFIAPHLFFAIFTRVLPPPGSSPIFPCPILRTVGNPHPEDVELQKRSLPSSSPASQKVTPIFSRRSSWFKNSNVVPVRCVIAVSFRSAWLMSCVRFAVPCVRPPCPPRSLRLRGQGRDGVDDDQVDRARIRTSISVISSACSPVSGCEIRRRSVSTPLMLRA